MTRRYRRRGRRPKALDALASALVFGVVLYAAAVAFTAIADNLAAVAAAFVTGAVFGHGLPSVRVIWRRR